MELWYRYASHECSSDYFGILDQLSLEELKELSEKSSRLTGGTFEVVYFDSAPICPHPGTYYGIDVAGEGYYSILGEGLLRPFYASVLTAIYNTHFLNRLNQYSLFASEDDANDFSASLLEWNSIFPNSIEDMEWKAFHVFGIE